MSSPPDDSAESSMMPSLPEDSSVAMPSMPEDSSVRDLESEQAVVSSPTSTEDAYSLPPDLKLEQVQKAIRDLLEICEQKQFEIPRTLKGTLLYTLGEGELPKKGRRRVGVKESIVAIRTQQMQSFAEDQLVKEFRELERKFKIQRHQIDLRVKNGSFKVTNYHDSSEAPAEKGAKQKVANVFNSSFLSALIEKVKRIGRTGKLCEKLTSEDQYIMEDINLAFESGKMYLVLGAPGSGKSSLLKMIAGTLQKDKDHEVGGTVSVDNFTQNCGDVLWSNVVGYIDQIDRLNPWLTVLETCEFSWRCRSGQTHATPLFDAQYMDDEIKKMDEALTIVNKALIGLGLARVANTFVGDQENVRGVSGGEKRRVTVAEMGVAQFPVLCADEISTGLDAATTFDIVRQTGGITRLTNTIKVVSLLQPPPETFALFDGLILLADGRVIYSGPVVSVVPYFESLGYEIPERMDVADWLQAIPTKDGKQFLKQQKGDDEEELKHLSSKEFSEKFKSSKLGQEVVTTLETQIAGSNFLDEAIMGRMQQWMKTKYRNSWYASFKLVVNREMVIWWRNKSLIRARIIQDMVMGLIAGTLFWQGSDDPTSVLGILFQSLFYVSVGAMLKIPAQFADRGVFYKQQDANFFPPSTYVLARSIAGIPASVIDGIVYGTIVFWFVGLAFDEGASVANYFMFMLLIFVTSMTASLIFGIFSTVTRNQSIGQAGLAVSIFLMVLFSGYTVQPDVIPDYWIWLYYGNFFAWALRGLAVNEFASGKYDAPSGVPGVTVGEDILKRFGFSDLDGNAYSSAWAGWSICFSLLWCVVSLVLSTYFLLNVRFATGKALGNVSEDESDDNDDDDADDSQEVAIPFQKVDLTFQDIRYTVQSSVGDERLELLKGIDGLVEAGKMTALMGSSGAGKTTLMDVLALRKSSGEIEGEVRLNGHLQEPLSFRRCMGYVEQFDVQSSQLTVRETCLFSATLRLESSDGAVTPESTAKFVDQTLKMLELTVIQDLQIGDDASGGLSFEQRKRLSIAIELVSNPSIIFLDEPTSGLDARAASIVMRGLKKIAKSGRAVCATIHQPSIEIFNSFDALLLLKRGGETVFFGDLGKESSLLISYLERYQSTPVIQPGQNPATWMLTTIGAGSASSKVKPFDYAGSFQASDLHNNCLARIAEVTGKMSDDGKVSFPDRHATPGGTQMRETLKRAFKIYWRSPSYNTVRLLTSTVIALVFGSIYVADMTLSNEADMNSRATSVFVAELFLGVNSFITVLSLFETERNMFYRHKAALMYTNRSILAAFTFAEIPFLLLASMIFVIIFYFMIGFTADVTKFFLFYLFFTLNMAVWTFLGQMFVALTRNALGAQGLGSLLLSLTSLFTGVLIRPSNIPNFWIFMYWLMPGHYVFEGLLTSQFQNDDTPITASPNSPFWVFLGCTADQMTATGEDRCVGTAENWVFATYGGDFEAENIPVNIAYLCGLLLVTRLITGFALAKLNFRST